MGVHEMTEECKIAFGGSAEAIETLWRYVYELQAEVAKLSGFPKGYVESKKPESICDTCANRVGCTSLSKGGSKGHLRVKIV